MNSSGVIFLALNSYENPFLTLSKASTQELNPQYCQV